jgi:hypothetical protein
MAAVFHTRCLHVGYNIHFTVISVMIYCYFFFCNGDSLYSLLSSKKFMHPVMRKPYVMPEIGNIRICINVCSYNFFMVVLR